MVTGRQKFHGHFETHDDLDSYSKSNSELLNHCDWVYVADKEFSFDETIFRWVPIENSGRDVDGTTYLDDSGLTYRIPSPAWTSAWTSDKTLRTPTPSDEALKNYHPESITLFKQLQAMSHEEREEYKSNMNRTIKKYKAEGKTGKAKILQEAKKLLKNSVIISYWDELPTKVSYESKAGTIRMPRYSKKEVEGMFDAVDYPTNPEGIPSAALERIEQRIQNKEEIKKINLGKKVKFWQR